MDMPAELQVHVVASDPCLSTQFLDTLCRDNRRVTRSGQAVSCICEDPLRADRVCTVNVCATTRPTIDAIEQQTAAHAILVLYDSHCAKSLDTASTLISRAVEHCQCPVFLVAMTTESTSMLPVVHDDPTFVQHWICRLGDATTALGLISQAVHTFCLMVCKQLEQNCDELALALQDGEGEGAESKSSQLSRLDCSAPALLPSSSVEGQSATMDLQQHEMSILLRESVLATEIAMMQEQLTEKQSKLQAIHQEHPYLPFRTC